MISSEYAAGFFDGEGCVYFRCLHRHTSRLPPSKRRARLRETNFYEWVTKLTLSNTNVDVLLAFKERWGGTLSTHLPNGRNCKPINQWALSQKKAEIFASDILPYSIVKWHTVHFE